MKSTYMLILVLNLSILSCQQNKVLQAQTKSGVIKSEKIIYYDIHTIKNERSYGFGKDVLNEYDGKGNLLKESIIVVDQKTGKETVNLSSLYHYENGKQRKMEKFSVLRGGVKNKEVVFSYNADGKLEKQEIKILEDGKEILNNSCFYTIYSYGKDQTETVYRFDENTRKFILSYRTVKEFDSRNNQVKETDYDEGNQPYRMLRSTYNDKNQLIRESRTDQSQDAENNHVYNAQGDILKTTYKDGGGMNCTYQYDDHGNWVEKTEKYITVSNGKSEVTDNQLIKRTIVYY